MEKREIVGKFHNSRITVLVPCGMDTGEYLYELDCRATQGDMAAYSKLRRIRRALCGVADCKCGGR